VGDEFDVSQQRQLQTERVAAERKVNPFQYCRSKYQNIAHDQEPIRRPNFRAGLCPYGQLFRYFHEFRLSFFAQEATKGEKKASPSRA